MSAIFVADIETSETEGIYKKILSQVKAISKLKTECLLVNKCKGCVAITYYNNGVLLESIRINEEPQFNKFKLNRLLNIKAREIVEQSSTIDVLYVRHMMRPSLSLLKLLMVAKKKKCQIIYEIPTYPYFVEQFFGSPNKFKTTIRLIIEVLMWPIIYYIINKLVVIVSRRSVHMLKKMFQVTNGIDISNIVQKNISDNDNYFRILGLGTIYKYHGYEKILYGISDCKGIVDNRIVEFHIVGESNEINNLKSLANSLGISNHIRFYGKKNKDELDDIFDQMDLAVGCLALYRRNADIDTTLKVIEYLVRGIPFITSGKIMNIQKNEETFMIIENNSKPVKISELYQFAKDISKERLNKTSILSKERFSWENIMSEILEI